MDRSNFSARVIHYLTDEQRPQIFFGSLLQFLVTLEALSTKNDTPVIGY